MADSAFAHPSNSEAQTASEIFEDAMRAAAEHRADQARASFEQVILEYPGSLEADQATRELAHMKAASEPPGNSAPAQAANVSAALPDEAGANDERDEPRTIESLRLEFLTTTGDRVFFPANAATIGTRARAILENQVRWLQRRPETAIRIIGRADDGGNADQARELSLKRAMAVHDQLLALGLPEGRVTFEARGDRDLVATCRDEACRVQNRQAETLLIEQRDITGETGQARPALARGAVDDPSAAETIAR